MADCLGRQRGRRGDESDRKHIAHTLCLQAQLVGGIAVGAIGENHPADDDGSKLPQQIFAGSGQAGGVNILEVALFQGEKFLSVLRAMEQADAFVVQKQQSNESSHDLGANQRNSRAG